MSEKENKFFNIATTGGKTIEEAYRDVYKAKDRKVLMTNIARKQKRSPVLFEEIYRYKRELFEKQKADHRIVYLEACKENALTILEKREILRKVITGESTAEEIVVIKGEPTKVIRKPTPYEIIRAIDLDSKIAGHFAPTTLKHEGGDSFIEFLKGFATVDNKNIPSVTGKQ